MGRERAVAHDEASLLLPNYSLWAIFVDSHSLWWEWEQAGVEQGDVGVLWRECSKRKVLTREFLLTSLPMCVLFWETRLENLKPVFLQVVCQRTVRVKPSLFSEGISLLCYMWANAGGAAVDLPMVQPYSENVMCLCCLKPHWCRWIPMAQVRLMHTIESAVLKTPNKFYLPYTRVPQRRPTMILFRQTEKGICASHPGGLPVISLYQLCPLAWWTDGSHYRLWP